MADEHELSKKNYTAPKGRPTRSRGREGGRRRVFGPVWQWLAVVVVVLMIFVIIVLVTNGGDFNPNNGAPAPAAVVADEAV